MHVFNSRFTFEYSLAPFALQVAHQTGNQFFRQSQQRRNALAFVIRHDDNERFDCAKFEWIPVECGQDRYARWVIVNA